MHSYNLEDLRRTSAEVMAAAVLELFPNVTLAGGHATPHGFFYDFHFPFSFNKEFIPLIEEKMRGIIKEKRVIEQTEMMPENAASFLKHHNQQLRASACAKQDKALVQMFRMGSFSDTCHFPFLQNTGEIGAFKIKEMEEGEEFTRLYGTAFFEKDQLKEFVRSRQTLKVKDHVDLGKEWDLFSPCKEKGKGFWRWHPKGEKIRQKLLDFWKSELSKENFDFISTPRVSSMTEAHIHTFFALKNRAPVVRLAECAYIQSEMPTDDPIGLFQSNGYFADRAHVFCPDSELLQESIYSLQIILKISKIFSFKGCKCVLCPSRAIWKEKENCLVQALRHAKIDYEIDKEARTERGPRVELRIKDVLGREWVGPFVEIDCVYPGRFDLKCALIVRSAFGSLERFVALLMENLQAEEMTFDKFTEKCRF